MEYLKNSVKSKQDEKKKKYWDQQCEQQVTMTRIDDRATAAAATKTKKKETES